MAAADKARFYLEKSVPDLQELSRKGVFSNEEITAIVKKRSDFEHTLNGYGSKPADYTRYVAYEMNLDALRKKRCTRLGVKSTTFSGQRTIFYIYDRATKKFPGDKKLWLQYIEYCQKEQANKKISKVFTAALRLAPRDWALWVLAAKHYAESQGDMTAARAYLQRGIRFNTDEKRLYLEYAKLELVYLSKLSARRKILGLDKTSEPEQTNVMDEDEDEIALPTTSDDDFGTPADKSFDHLNIANLQRIAEGPLLQGAVPLAIYDAAMAKFKDDASVAESFFLMSLEFKDVDAVVKFREHILTSLEKRTPIPAEAFVCQAAQSLAGAHLHPEEYPKRVRDARDALKSGMVQGLSAKTRILWLRAIQLFIDELHREQTSEMDAAIVTVVVATLRQYVRQMLDGIEGCEVSSIVQQLLKLKPQGHGESLEELCQDWNTG